MSELTLLRGHVSEIAKGLKVRRVLPAAAKRSVGPFVFFDHMGPVTIPPEIDSDVGAHPHIGLATLTYLFEGSFIHRDSVGSVQLITPGDVNWMIAGSGVVHSERVSEEERGKSRRLHGLQLWVALPPELEEMNPSFQHVAARDIPQCEPEEGVVVRVLVGEAFGLVSPVKTTSNTLYLDVQMSAGSQWCLPPLAEEMGIYSPEFTLSVGSDDIPAQQMCLVPTAANLVLRAGDAGARFVVIGGAPLKQPVRMWWNFVSVDRERLAEAAYRWETGDFTMIPGETERLAAPRWTD